MEQFVSTPKKWGNSTGIVIPKHIARQIKESRTTRVRVMLAPAGKTPQELTFGKLAQGQDLQQAMREIDEGYDE